MCALGHSNIIFLLEYSECFIMDARMCWRSLCGSVVFIRASDAPNILFLEELFTDGVVNSE